MNLRIISLILQSLFSIFAFIYIFIDIRSKSKERNTPIQCSYLILGLFLMMIHMILLTIVEINFNSLPLDLKQTCIFLNRNFRLILLFMEFYEVNYIVLYFTRFRFDKALKKKDKVFFVIIQNCMNIIPFLWIVSVMIGNNTLIMDLSPWYRNGTMFPLIILWPESALTNDLMRIVFIFYLILALLPINIMLNKHKHIKIAYFSFILTILFRIVLINLSFVDSIFFILPNLGIIFSLIQNLFFVFIVVVGRGITNENNSIIAK